jgi:ABC-type phosphate transport system substrate-binding protein
LRNRIPAALLALTLAAPPAALVAQARPASQGFLVIVHPSNPLSRLDQKFLANAFLKKTTRWDNDVGIRPVDLGPDSPVRRRFSQDVVGRPVDGVKSYWQQQLFSGRDVPPPELDSDDEVVKYVLRFNGAVGYVSSSADIRSAKVVAVK